MRKLMLAVGLAAVGLFAVGCDTANSAAKQAEKGAKQAAAAAEQAADKAKEAAKEAGDAARETVVKPIEAMYEKIEEKLKGLSGDAATKAREKFAALKTLVEEFRKSPADGMKAAQEKLTAAFDELKKLVGL